MKSLHQVVGYVYLQKEDAGSIQKNDMKKWSPIIEFGSVKMGTMYQLQKDSYLK